MSRPEPRVLVSRTVILDAACNFPVLGHDFATRSSIAIERIGKGCSQALRTRFAQRIEIIQGLSCALILRNEIGTRRLCTDVVWPGARELSVSARRGQGTARAVIADVARRGFHNTSPTETTILGQPSEAPPRESAHDAPPR
jgi:hypothetical protein